MLPEHIFMTNGLSLENAYQLNDEGYYLVFFNQYGTSWFKLFKEN